MSRNMLARVEQAQRGTVRPAQLVEELFWQRCGTEEHLQHVVKTDCCGAKLYKPLAAKLGVCPSCDRPLNLEA